MTSQDMCRIVRGNGSYEGRQGLTYFAGISAESVGARGICMHVLRMPPEERAKAHLHEAHETAIFALSGQAGMWYGKQLERNLTVQAGDYLYIPASALSPWSGYGGRRSLANRPE